MDEKDTYRSAKLLINHYGADAAIYAAMRVDALIEASVRVTIITVYMRHLCKLFRVI